MNYRVIPVTSFIQNCSLLWCKQSRLGVLVDPGGDAVKIKREIMINNVILTQILLTHGHIDHVGSANEISRYYGIPIIGPEKGDEFWLRELPTQSYMFNFKKCQPIIPNRWLTENENIIVGNILLRVLHCPGHTPGHVVFFNKEERLLISGDVIFKGSIGRSDFPKSDYSQLIQSIKNKILSLGDDVTFIAGHGPISTLGYERQHNLYLRE